jgi:hypothetical protein
MMHFATQSLLKRTRFLLAIGVIAWFVVFPVYLYLSALDDLDGSSPCLSLKALDQDASVSMLDPKEKTLIHIFGVKEHSEQNLFFESTRNSYASDFDPRSKQFILRC